MPLVKHDGNRYSEIKAALRKKDEKYLFDYVVCSAVVGKYWTEMLSMLEERVLSFIVCRTFLYRKKAEAIAPRHFLEGIAGTCGPCGVKKTALRQALTSLSEKGFITVHAFVAQNAETVWRVYEVNLDRITAGRDIGELEHMSRRLTGIAAETPSTTRSTPLRAAEDITSLLRNELTTTNVVVSAASLPTPRKPRKTVAINCKPGASPTELLEAISSRHKDNREARASKYTAVPTKRWAKIELQAILDKARERCTEEGYTVPRVLVVDKCLNVLHKRLLAAEVKNPLDFFEWSFKHWATVAGANRSSKARQARESGSSTGSAMLNTPNFTDLAYRAPYILAFYNEREFTAATEQRAKAETDKAQKRTADRFKEATEARKAEVRERDLAREKVLRREDKESTSTIRRRTRTRPAPSADDIPEFKDREWTGK